MQFIITLFSLFAFAGCNNAQSTKEFKTSEKNKTEQSAKKK